MTTAKKSEKDRVIIFDTTLRDGEQCPGATMTFEEKIEIAEMLDDMGVDVIEAGFPITSEGDFQAVSEIARRSKNSVIAGLSHVAYLLVLTALSGGVMAGPLVSSRSEYLEQDVRNQQGLLGNAQQRATDLGQVQPLFNLTGTSTISSTTSTRKP